MNLGLLGVQLGRSGFGGASLNAQIAALFASSQPGIVTDLTDMTSLYQTSDGATAVSALDQPVGLVLDKRMMSGQTAAAFIASQPELVTNGNFATDTNWTKGTGWSISGGQAISSGAATFSDLIQTIVAPSGEYYQITVDVTRTSGNLLVWIGTSATLVTINSSGSKTFIIRASGSNSIIFDTSGSAFVGSIDNVSVKAVPGNHLIQATSNSRPLWKADGANRYLLFDGVDDRMAAAFTITNPCERISALRQISWTSGRFIFGGITAYGHILYQVVTTPEISLFASANAATNANAVIGNNVVVAEVFNGASSSITVNNGTPTTGNPGSNVSGGITVAAEQGGFNHSNIRLYSTIERQGTFTAAERALCTQYANRSIGL